MIDPDIRVARGLPASAYVDPAIFERSKDAVFARSWQLAGDTLALDREGDVRPLVLLPGHVDEPLFLVRGERGLACRPNVCTHRGNVVVTREERGVSGLRCRYHGRRFDLGGRCLSMPEFDGVPDFPAQSDDLANVALARWGRFAFVRLAGDEPFEPIAHELDRWLGFLDTTALALDPARSRDYEVGAHWALYCENYLEGFHIPFVHPALAGALEWRDYRTTTSSHCVVQVGAASDADRGRTLALPQDHPAGSGRVAALYVFVLPNLMLNVYPWGLSLNLVEPLAIDRTRVRFVTYVGDASSLGDGAGGDVHRVEMEDEEVVESVQCGVRSRFFERARFSPTQEIGVHWLHRALAERLGLE